MKHIRSAHIFYLILCFHFVLNGCVRQDRPPIKNEKKSVAAVEVVEQSLPPELVVLPVHSVEPLPADFSPSLKHKPQFSEQQQTEPEKSLMDAFVEYFWPSETPKKTPIHVTGGLNPWHWPVKGEVRDPFGPAHDGINIAASENTVVTPVAPGKVVYSGDMLMNYGNLVIVDHQNGWLSVYGHLKKAMVHEGQTISNATTLGYVGTSGNAQTPQLHLEMRYHEKPVDPLRYLP